MKEETYKIKPLVWEGEINEPNYTIVAKVPFGKYIIGIDRDGITIWTHRLFDDRYWRDYICKDVKEGKELAEKHWNELIVKSLTPISDKENLKQAWDAAIEQCQKTLTHEIPLTFDQWFAQQNLRSKDEDLKEALEILLLQNEDGFDRGAGKYILWEFIETYF